MSIYLINIFTLIKDVTIKIIIKDIQAHLPISIAYTKAKPADLDSNIIIQVFNFQSKELHSAQLLHPLRAELEILKYGQ